MKRWVIGVDLGGTKIAFGVMDAEGNIAARLTRPTLPGEGVGPVISRISGGITEVMATLGIAAGDVRGIGIGSPGPLNPVSGVVIFAPNLKWHNVPVKDMVEAELGIPVYLENDANLAALGELRFGAGQGAKNMIYITVSTGIGGGIIINGDVYSGSTFVAGEVGHTIIKPDGPQCGCGQYGCLEAMASGTAIARMAREAIAAGEKTMIREIAGGDAGVNAEVVARATLAGDGVALAIIREAATYLGLGVTNLVNILNPEVVVIGGGVSRIGDMLFDTVRTTVRERAVEGAREAVRIVPAQLGSDAGIVGAATLALKLAPA
ncbi:MAG: ROK family glucokinase [Firmicutes bacterium]|nr:ROK family glucokinase [Bacillota bacterium]